MRIIKFSDLETTPWKNGGGITREIAAEREKENIIWRMSMADVESDGPFSIFTGLTRILTVIEGDGIALTSVDRTFQATLGTPVTFDGGLAIHSKLIDGAIRDLNVMYDPNRCFADVMFVASPAHFGLYANARRTIAAFGLEGETLVDREHILHFGDTVLINTGPIELHMTGRAAALIITLNLLD